MRRRKRRKERKRERRQVAEEAEEKGAEQGRKKERRVFSHYKIEGEKLERLLPFCERCGLGYFMADHGDRYTCGHCGFTRYKKTETGE